MTDKEHAGHLAALRSLADGSLAVELRGFTREDVMAIRYAIDMLRQGELLRAKARCWDAHEAVSAFSSDPNRRHSTGHLAASQRLSEAIKDLCALEKAALENKP